MILNEKIDLTYKLLEEIICEKYDFLRKCDLEILRDAGDIIEEQKDPEEKLPKEGE